MKAISDTAWSEIRKVIEGHLEQDSNITDVLLSYQVKESKYKVKNILKLNVTIEV
tara:strand:+ start:20 stop:184 length:165 start_codon:yes stop_codon:yes gene_type:complete